MSYDLSLKFKSPPRFDMADFEAFILSYGIIAETDPKFDSADHSGFLPIRLNGRTFDEKDTSDYISGFEFYAGNECAEEMSYLRRILGMRPRYEISLGCHEAHEILLAHAFCCYMVTKHKAVYDNPQTGAKDSETDKELRQIKDEVVDIYRHNELELTAFEGWDKYTE